MIIKNLYFLIWNSFVVINTACLPKAQNEYWNFDFITPKMADTTSQDFSTNSLQIAV